MSDLVCNLGLDHLLWNFCFVVRSSCSCPGLGFVVPFVLVSDFAGFGPA
jgi:hypothetical protein